MKKNYCHDHIRAYYEEGKDFNQENYAVLGWESQEAQFLRFSVLAKYVPVAQSSLLDVGCGLGDLVLYLDTHKKSPLSYCGVDISKKIVEKANSETPHLDITYHDIFADNDFRASKRFDVVYTSGIFNLKFNDNYQFLTDAVDYFYDLSCAYVVFNLLSIESKSKEDPYFYFDRKKVEAILERYNFCEITIVDQYLHNDFTVICRK